MLYRENKKQSFDTSSIEDASSTIFGSPAVINECSASV